MKIDGTIASSELAKMTILREQPTVLLLLISGIDLQNKTVSYSKEFIFYRGRSVIFSDTIVDGAYSESIVFFEKKMSGCGRWS